MNIAIIGSELYRQEIDGAIRHIENEDIINHNQITPKDINSFARGKSKAEISQLLKSCRLGYVITGSGKRQIRNEINTITLLYIHVLKGWGIPMWLSHPVDELDQYNFQIVSSSELKASLSEFKSKV